ncbi:hypothetical protein [Pseudobutyrivibrio xylanivorans]|uniref:DUF5067 domain-containing protein n=1 Tax=Pseudobutyrivibrio xylanivorans DSM 14809 TaxID=1123012 RepID=A0A1M6BCP7_PSEXY|nr:hypothetical protein [Pseudobutyrivibrio xylanivorans]SHI46489.1 hypothetical protein SAMN02745725_00416 [Pseudobutyrivibrio xylanivorans DSM 14809]
MTKINSVMKKVFSLGLALTMVMSMVGCGQSADVDTMKTAQIDDEEVAMSAVTYFTKGVYANYAAEAENPDKTYFYVFYGDGSGSIDDGVTGTKTYFEYEVGYDDVTFHIGSVDPTDEVFSVKEFKDSKVVGSFSDGLELVFEPVEGVDTDSFDAVNYVNEKTGEDFVYTDANGWQVKYNPDVIQVNQGGPVTTFVYTGDCAGTCMITATYTVDNKGEGAIKAIGDAWGSDTNYSESIFPGTEDVTCYYAAMPVSDDSNSGLHCSALGRDYMDGALTFEFTVHNSGDDAIDIPVSDAFSAIIDSIEFVQ